MKHRQPIYGLMAEFPDLPSLLRATREAHDAGYRHLDTYTPFPVEELGEMLDGHHSRLPLLVLIGGIVGGVAGYALQYWTSVIDYPLNIGGRPLASWPAFIVPSYELTILFAALTAVIGMIALNGLPMPYHPVFNVPQFSNASSDRFFLSIETKDPKFDLAGTRAFLEGLHPLGVTEIEG